MKLLALAALAATASAHMSLIYPKPRNAIDSQLPEWSGGKAPYRWPYGAQPKPTVREKDVNTDFVCCDLFNATHPPPADWRTRFPASAPGIKATGRNDTVPAYNLSMCIDICTALYDVQGVQCRAAAWNSGLKQCFLKWGRANLHNKTGDTSFLLGTTGPGNWPDYPCACRNGTQPCESAQTCLWFSVGCTIGCETCDGGSKGGSNPNREDRCGSGKNATINDPAQR
jgi:hypothetical protein